MLLSATLLDLGVAGATDAVRLDVDVPVVGGAAGGAGTACLPPLLTDDPWGAMPRPLMHQLCLDGVTSWLIVTLIWHV